MIAHFEKLNTRLRSVQKYPTLDAQSNRFQQLGWTNISIRNLWELWASPDFLSSSERQALDYVEPFDEWEEFALFGCHYFLLVAGNNPLQPTDNNQKSVLNIPGETKLSPSMQVAQVLFSENPKGHACARFGAVLALRGSDRGRPIYGNHGGMGLKSRMDSCDVFAPSGFSKVENSLNPLVSPIYPSSRMCHTITDMEDGTSLLVGGRTSPDKGLTDCWLHHRWAGVWEPIDNLPYPLYRHQAVYLGRGCVILSTGRINSHELSEHYLIWSRRLGWVTCQTGDEVPPVTYGSMFLKGFTQSTEKTYGLIAGGLSRDGVIQTKLWRWEIEGSFTEVLHLFLLFEKDSSFNGRFEDESLTSYDRVQRSVSILIT